MERGKRGIRRGDDRCWRWFVVTYRSIDGIPGNGGALFKAQAFGCTIRSNQYLYTTSSNHTLGFYKLTGYSVVSIFSG